MLVAAKADKVCILDVASLCNFTEHMVLATGRSHRHIQAAAQAVAHQVSQLHTVVIQAYNAFMVSIMFEHTASHACRYLCDVLRLLRASSQV